MNLVKIIPIGKVDDLIVHGQIHKVHTIARLTIFYLHLNNALLIVEKPSHVS